MRSHVVTRRRTSSNGRCSDPTPASRPTRSDRRVRAIRIGAVLSLAGGATALAVASTASAASTPTLSANPSTGLTNGQSVTVTGSGYAASSPGNILECNNDPNEPTVSLPAPISSDVSVGCTAPSYNLVVTSKTGTISTTYKVIAGTLGPPCGASSDIITTCPSTDSAGNSPSADAANYPCPPTPAEQAAGVTCSLSFGDSSGDGASTVILFQGETPPPSTTSTAPSSTTSPSTTAPSSTTTTTTASTTTTSTAPTTSTTGAGSGGTTSTTSAGGTSGTSGTSGLTTASSSSLAFTGAGRPLWWLLSLGLLFLLLGAALWSLTYFKRVAPRD
jgi:hypothetical protein